ncbi:MAG: MCP four helix bundle domain-containing protein, partial [Gammaproteobacteria bacterium]
MGFSIILGLLVITGLVAYQAMHSASVGFKEYREMARDTNLSGRVQANMLMVRMNVKDYIITASDKDKAQFEEYWGRTSKFMAEAQKEINDPKRAKMINEVDQLLTEYRAGFKQVVDLIARRNDIVYETLNKRGPSIEKDLTKILLSSKKDNDMSAAYEASLATRSLLLARLYSGKFLDTNDNAAVERVHQEFKQMAKHLKVLDRELQNPQRRALLSKVAEGKKVYEKAFDDVVKTITTRNDIIKNTLDRIGPKVATDIEKVKLEIKGVQDTLGPQLQDSNDHATLVIGLCVLLALFLGAFIAYFITRST